MPVLTGSCWLRPNNGDPQQLSAGDVLLVRSPTRYALSSTPDADASITIGPNQTCSGADGRDLAEELNVGLRTWATTPRATTNCWSAPTVATEKSAD